METDDLTSERRRRRKKTAFKEMTGGGFDLSINVISADRIDSNSNRVLRLRIERPARLNAAFDLNRVTGS